MKYAKKMKLVEIDDSNISSNVINNSRIADEDYSKPFVLSTLDNVMNEILKAPMSDFDKWQLYSQTLQRYLNRVKVTSRKTEPNFTYPENNEERKREKDPFNFSLHPLDSIKNTLGSTSRLDPFEISGVEPIRDSLDSISQPAVRNFFENARKSNVSPLATPSHNIQEEVSPSQQKRKKTKTIPRRRGRKRPAENSLSISHIRPCKVLLKRWEPTNAH